MLNRRTLRIKIMQSLFAYDQCKDANHQLSLEHIESHFQPDLNSMEIQDKNLLKEKRRSARQLLERKFLHPDTADIDDQEINDVVLEALTTYHKNVKKDGQLVSKMMVQAVERINDLYFSILGLIIAFADLAGADKKADYRNFVSNRLVAAFKANHELIRNLAKPAAGWQQRADKVRSWFIEVVRPDQEFRTYNEARSATLEDDKAIIKHISRKLILGKGAINSQFEEDDIYWSEDHEIVRSLVDKTLKSYDEATGVISLQKLTLDWDDDREFMVALFSGAISLPEKFKKLISRNTKNWEVDRLPLTDRIILEMAITELVTFQHIPVKVTINEYIELAKLYSTPKSRQFINGILDVIAKELAASGDLKKSGRGLIDNK